MLLFVPSLGSVYYIRVTTIAVFELAVLEEITQVHQLSPQPSTTEQFIRAGLMLSRTDGSFDKHFVGYLQNITITYPDSDLNLKNFSIGSQYGLGLAGMHADDCSLFDFEAQTEETINVAGKSL